MAKSNRVPFSVPSVQFQVMRALGCGELQAQQDGFCSQSSAERAGQGGDPSRASVKGNVVIDAQGTPQKREQRYLGVCHSWGGYLEPRNKV